MSKRTLISMILGVCSVVGFLAFQNCSTPVQGSLFENQELQSLSEDAPFAFDSTIDEIAYNSCSEMGGVSTPSVMFAIKAGAYSTGGVKLTSAFRSFLSTIDSKKYDPTEVFAYAPTTAGITAQLDLRNDSSLLTRQSVAGYTDTSSLLKGGVFSDAEKASALVAATTSRVRLFPNPSGGAATRFETTLSFHANDITANQMRGVLSDAGAASLTLVYMPYDGTGGQIPLAPVALSSSKAATSIYGRGYKFNFIGGAPGYFNEAGGPSADVSGRYRIMSAVNERNLDRTTGVGEGSSSWSCAQNMRFKVVRQVDRATYCPAAAENSSDARVIKVRNLLPADTWDINFDRQCVVLRNEGHGLCYGQSPLNNKVVYDLTQACGTTNGACAHFISVCTR